MNKVVIINSTVTGIHQTNIGSCEEVVLKVVKDDSIPNIDPHCMKVMFPETVSVEILNKVTWPKNPAHKRFNDQLVRDCLGKKVGNVPANMGEFFRKCIRYCPYLTSITWYVSSLLSFLNLTHECYSILKISRPPNKLCLVCPHRLTRTFFLLSLTTLEIVEFMDGLGSQQGIEKTYIVRHWTTGMFSRSCILPGYF